MAKKKKKSNKKKVFMWTGITIGIIALIVISLGILINVTGVQEEWEFQTSYGDLTFKITNPFYHWMSEQAAFVDDDEIELGDEVCWTEMTNVDWMDGCVERIEWEIQMNGVTKKTIGKDLSNPKCSGQLTYSECWEPRKEGEYQIVTYYIMDDGNVGAESASESYFVVEEAEPECDSQDYRACYSGNLWWYDSCGEREDIAQQCDYGCENNQCKSPPADCSSGQTKCEGSIYYTCNSGGSWQSQGVMLNQCNVNCIDNSDCSTNQVCNAQYQCVDDGSGEDPNPNPDPNPWPWIIGILIAGILIVAIIIVVVMRLRK